MIETVKFELRELNSSDIFLMSRIIKKIGVANFKKCFDNDAIKEVMAKMSNKENQSDEDLKKIGVAVAFEIIDVIFDRLPECETELYDFLSSVSGIKVIDLKKLSMPDFLEMVIAVVKKPEFKDFFEVASRLFK